MVQPLRTPHSPPVGAQPPLQLVPGSCDHLCSHHHHILLIRAEVSFCTWNGDCTCSALVLADGSWDGAVTTGRGQEACGAEVPTELGGEGCLVAEFKEMRASMSCSSVSGHINASGNGSMRYGYDHDHDGKQYMDRLDDPYSKIRGQSQRYSIHHMFFCTPGQDYCEINGVSAVGVPQCLRITTPESTVRTILSSSNTDQKRYNDAHPYK